MRIERSLRNEISADDAFEMTVTQAFQEKKCADAGALSWTVSIERDGDRVVVRTRRMMPTVGFPSLLRKFVPSGITATEIVRWAPPDEGGTRRAELSVDFHGAPVSMSGTVRLAPAGERASTVVVDALFTANVPLVGRQIEKFAAPIIVHVIDAEQKTTVDWVAGVR